MAGHFEDITGQRFGRLVAVEYAGYKEYGEKKQKFHKWKFRCDCGNDKVILLQSVRNGDTQSCGCVQKESRTNMRHYKDLSGIKVGRLSVIKYVGNREYGNNKVALWECMCDCGNTVTLPQIQLKTKSDGYSTRSCGCLLKEMKDISNPQSLFFEGTHRCFISSDKLTKANKSGIKGVYFDKSKNKWVAEIMFKRKKYYLGAYADIRDAAKARKQAEEMLFEPFLEWYKENFNKSEREIAQVQNAKI